ncbi:YciI family protein [Couchioplanes caeruleus]|uniref:YCII-related domain-containing protein n=2 Tax=Couchioplanes caeruleus TaxID=56438 RepID=A0A1K0FDY3_9ACTN|nr:YciI family protein [Couchioplanes caeruleus]OJF11053.1 hypothetical protein BG844_28295 [Couchioplanes caeruleus subsp. caeruleus]ROP33672.1 hypothetical protein EDD30_6699 [Couchioplanes caeruleus]
MKYLILIYNNEQTRQIWEGLSGAERAEGMQAHMSLVEDLSESGEFIVMEALADPAKSKTVSVRDGRPVSSDGPFAEVKEYLVGFYLVECENIDRAVEHAARIPEAAMGLVEVRPVLARGATEM